MNFKLGFVKGKGKGLIVKDIFEQEVISRCCFLLLIL